ncbi:hypothetical protein PNOK_0665700 [Pyrrhoderma noxium]|uniref:Uncharacterized protein n=1 Tax=Pyrrhoderma noxium TaxID=2282107 RepID=A0A286UF05_9AGAM|nr:hypothetical protein PNOK_0665700 [Pyrrhoderma noxium]
MSLSPLHSHSQQPHPLQPPPIPPSSSSSYPRAPRSRLEPESDKVFGRLSGELRCTAASPVFGALLEGTLERAGEVMFEDVGWRVFGGGVDGADGGDALDTISNELVDL